MSASAPVALDAPGPRPSELMRGLPRPSVTTVAFVLLGVLGVVRWETMLAHPPVGRMLGLVALALVVVLLAAPAQHGSPLASAFAIAGTALAVVAMIPMSGLPLEWALHLRIAVTARAIAHGLSQLPGVIVPYRGGVRATRSVIALGAGLLLLGTALTLAASRRPRGRALLAAAALPLLVLAVVPSALARPRFAVLHGALLFALLALFVFSERLTMRRGLWAVVAVLVTGLSAMAVSHALEPSRPWFRFETVTIAGGPGSAVVTGGETFDWMQTYGPFVWPHTGRTVLDIRAARPYYWKAQDFDVFDGRGWRAAPIVSGDPYAGVTPEALSRWSQTLTVTVRGLVTSDVIAAGIAEPPLLPGGAGARGGDAPGTFTTQQPLRPGTTYRVRVYAPAPPPAELEVAGTAYPAATAGAELTVELPVRPGSQAVRTVRFEPYGSRARIAGATAGGAGGVIAATGYGGVLALAERLEAGTTTPYQYVQAVLRYLARGFIYTETPPATALPILAFLERTHAGYCQQFAGAMALLLRMGGVPARVAAGFATGGYDARRHRYVVSDIDAHAWVEAFFPGLGWVKFDPTPSIDPALARQDQPLSGGSPPPLLSKGSSPAPKVHPSASRAGSRSHHATASAGGGLPAAAVTGIVLAALALLGIGGGAWALARRPVSPAALLTELERAFVRCGRPLAAAYVRTLRQARYGPGRLERPSLAGRRAVRRRLARGLGLLGGARAWLALPPLPRRSLD